MTNTELIETPKAMLKVVERAQAGDVEALPALQDMLDRVPEIRELLGADLEHTVQESISNAMGDQGDLAFREAIQRKLVAMREELEGPSSSPIERLLVDRIVATWLQIQDADLRYAQAGNRSLAQMNFHRKRQDSTNRRFLAAVKTLAQVRKMALPVLQVNVGANQVSVASAVVNNGE